MNFAVRTAAIILIAGCLAGALPGTAETAAEDGLVVYYFHTDFRCPTCKKIEAYTTEAINGGFSEELESGELAWRVVNTDRNEDKHFVEDFELVTKSVVLVEYRDGEVKRFKNLKLIWKLVGDKDGFVTYVRNETRDFIGAE